MKQSFLFTVYIHTCLDKSRFDLCAFVEVVSHAFLLDIFAQAKIRNIFVGHYFFDQYPVL